MRILWIYRVLADGHTHITTWRETHRHLKARHDIHYVFPYKRERRCFTDNVTLIKKRRLPGVAFVHFFLAGLVAFLRQHRSADVVIFDQFTAPYSLIYLFRSRRPLLILDLRQAKYSNQERWISGTLMRAYTRWVLRINRRHHDAITYISEGLRHQLLKDMPGCLNERYLVWPSGVDPEVFRPLSDDGIEPQGPLRLFFHGSVTKGRGLAESVEAIALCQQRGTPVEFTIVGEGEFLEELKGMARELGVLPSVRFLELVPYERVPALIARAEVCMMAYPASEYWEGNVPIKLLEYMAMERVILCSEMKIFRQVTKGTSCARFIPDSSPSEIANALAHLYENRSKLQEWGRVGRRLVSESYTWQAISDDIDRFLVALARERESSGLDLRARE